MWGLTHRELRPFARFLKTALWKQLATCIDRAWLRKHEKGDSVYLPQLSLESMTGDLFSAPSAKGGICNLIRFELVPSCCASVGLLSCWAVEL